MSDGKSTEEAMTKKMSQVLAADAVRRLTQKEELVLKPERLLRMRWVLTRKYTDGGDRNSKARMVILGYQHTELASIPTAAPTLGKMPRHLLPCTNFGSILVTFPQLSWKHLPRKSIKS